MLDITVNPSFDSKTDVVDCHKIAIVDERLLSAECMVRSLQEKRPEDHVYAYPNVIDWIASPDSGDDDTIVVLSIGARRADDSLVAGSIANLRDACPRNPIIILADSEDAAQVLLALEQGARGYIPTSVSLDVAVNAMLLVVVGGTFIPSSSLTSSRNAIRSDGGARLAIDGVFTARQSAVVEALRKGKANKVIAYELNMRESTVKVHVRNIMKKLKAKNRTEVAFITNNQINIEDSRRPAI